MANLRTATIITPPSITAGPALTAAAAASCIPTDSLVTLPAGFFVPGKQLRISMSGKVSTVITTPGTARFDVRIGAVIAWDSLAILLDTVAAHTDKPWQLELLLTCRTAGAGTVSKLIGTGMFFSESILGVTATQPKATAIAMLPWASAPAVGTGFASTTTNTLDVFFTQTVATGSLTVEQYLVEDLG